MDYFLFSIAELQMSKSINIFVPNPLIHPTRKAEPEVPK
jgi:hypothetical protein